MLSNCLYQMLLHNIFCQIETCSSRIQSFHTFSIFYIAGLLKEYLRELPEPVFSNCLYQMLVDAMGVFLPDDPDGNAKLVFSILDCLPKANRVSINGPVQKLNSVFIWVSPMTALNLVFSSLFTLFTLFPHFLFLFLFYSYSLFKIQVNMIKRKVY